MSKNGTQTPDTLRLPTTAFGILAICAIRYCRSERGWYFNASERIQTIIRPHLPELSDKHLKEMLRDCELHRDHDMYGDPVIDKPGWLEWEKLVREEAERRGITV